MLGIPCLNLALMAASSHGDRVLWPRCGQDTAPVKSHQKLVVFDSGPTVGGVWFKDRLCPGLKTNNM